jgi:DNA-binding HxlR family transcriptional regulator
MDVRTTLLLDALAHPGASILLILCEQQATEAQLLVDVPTTTQATTNRRLAELERLGLIERDAGKPQAPGRPWRLVHSDATEQLLRAAMALSDAQAEAEGHQRQAARRRLNKAKAARLGIRRIREN